MIIERDGKLTPMFRLPKEEQEAIKKRFHDATPKITEKQANDRAARISFSLMEHPVIGTCSHVGWGEHTIEVKGRMTHLGFDYGRSDRTPKRGFRRAIYDICYGYVSGFAVKDIIWYVFTRSLNYRKRPGYMKKWEAELAVQQEV